MLGETDLFQGIFIVAIKKTTESSFMVVGVPAEIGKVDIPDTL